MKTESPATEQLRCLGCGTVFTGDGHGKTPDKHGTLAIHLAGAGSANCRDAYCEANRLYRLPGTWRLVLVDSIHARLNAYSWAICGIDPTGGLLELDVVRASGTEARKLAAKYRVDTEKSP